MKVSEMTAEVRGRLFDSSVTADFTGPEILAWLNQAQLEFVARTKCLEEVGTTDLVDGVNDYDLPWDCLRVVRISAPTGKVYEADFSEYDRYVDEAISYERLCSRYVIFNDMIRLWPAPDATVDEGLKLWYARRPTVLASDNAVPEIPDEYHECLVAFAVSRASMKDGERDDSMAAEGQFNAKVVAFKREKRKTSDGTSQIRNVW